MRGFSLTGFTAFLGYLLMLCLCYGRHAISALRFVSHCRLHLTSSWSDRFMGYRTFDPVLAQLAHERQRTEQAEAESIRKSERICELEAELVKLKEERPRNEMQERGMALRLVIGGTLASALIVSVICIPMRINEAPPRPMVVTLVIELPEEVVHPYWVDHHPSEETFIYDGTWGGSLDLNWDMLGCARHTEDPVPMCWDGCPNFLLIPQPPFEPSWVDLSGETLAFAGPWSSLE